MVSARVVVSSPVSRFLTANGRRCTAAIAVTALFGGCTVVSGVGDLDFDLDPAGAGGSDGGASSSSSGGAGGEGGGGSDGAGGMAPPPMMPVSDDFAVGTAGPNGGVDFQPGLSVTADGTFVVAWSDFGSPAPDGDFSGIFYDTFTATTCASCFQLANVTTAGSQLAAHGAGVPGGTTTLYGWNTTSGGQHLQAIFIDTNGNKVGNELTVADADWVTVGSPWAGFTNAPAEVTVAWMATDSADNGIYAAHLAPGATAVPAGTLVNADEMDSQIRPAVGVDGSGRALVAWVERSARFIEARILDAGGTPVGADISIDDDTSPMCAPMVAASADRFIVVYGKGTCDGGEFPIGGRIFAVVVDGDGTVHPPVEVSDDAEATTPDVAFDGEHYVVVWSQALAGDGGRGLQRRRLWQDGSIADPIPQPVHPATSDRAECLPSVTADANGRVAIAWSACDAGCVSARAFPPMNTNTCKVRMRYFE